MKAKRYGSYVKKVTVPTPPENPQQLIDLFVNATTPQTRVWAIPHLTSGTAVLFPVAHLSATVVSGQWDNYHDGAYRFMQIGSGNLSLLKGYEAAVDFHNRIGPARVEARMMMLANRLREGLRQIPQVRITSPLHPELLTATTVWALQGYTGPQLMDELWNRAKIRCRSMGEGVRQGCAIYCLPEDVDRTLSTVRALVRRA